MEQLPEEALLKNLHPVDRLNCALLCKRWAGLVATSRLLEDTRLVLENDDLDRAVPILLKSNRCYIHLKLAKVTLHEFNAEFWTRIAKSLRTLEIRQCDLSNVVFYSILQECRQLESLRIIQEERWMTPSFDDLIQPPENVDITSVRKSLRNVRHLSLPGLTDASFKQMFRVMPNVTSLCLSESFALFGSSRNVNFENLFACMRSTKQEYIDLDFSHTGVDSRSVAKIVKRYEKSLRRLRLDVCEVDSEAFVAIARCTKLQHLYVAGNLFESKLKEILSNNRDLKDLGLCSCSRIECLSPIVEHDNIRHLNLKYCGSLSPDSLGALAQMTKLQLLKLRYVDFNSEAIRLLAPLEDLRVLVIDCFESLDEEYFTIICDNLKKLEELRLENCTSLGDRTGVKFQQLRQLWNLEIYSACGMTDASFVNPVGSPNMKVLDIYRSRMTDSALINIASHHVYLERVELPVCDQITDVGLIHLVQRLRRLRRLSVTGCSLISDRSLEAIRQNCPYLKFLDVYQCSVSKDACRSFARLRPKVFINYESKFHRN